MRRSEGNHRLEVSLSVLHNVLPFMAVYVNALPMADRFKSKVMEAMKCCTE